MENVIYEDSPLAEYLEGEARGASGSPPSPPPERQNFAPRGPSTLQSRIRNKLPTPLRIQIGGNGSVARIHGACSKAVNARLGRADNQRFLEHFRYLVVASQLLGEQAGLRATALPNFPADGPAQQQDFRVATTNLTGAALTGGTAFVLVWLLHWSRARANGFSKSRFCVVLAVFAAIATTCYAYLRRQWLQYLRQQAVDGASVLVTNLQAFEASTSSAIALIQEVELVSRGYRLSSPLPPISRIEEKGQARRCHRLRRSLQTAFAAAIPVFAEQCGSLKQLIEEDDLEKYLDVYDINNPDLQEAAQGYSKSEFEDAETLKALRILQYRLSTLRRVYLCSLLALEANGGKPDFTRWAVAVESMESMAAPTGQWSEKINRILAEEEQFVLPSPHQKTQPSAARDRLRNSVRKLGSLSQGIRGLQAKMQILREESNKSLEESDDVTDLGAHLMTQYESIGADLKSLVQAWESGKSALALNIDRHERRISQASSGLRSPVPSLGGLTAVEEGSPSDALRALNGDLLSPRQSAPSSVEGSNSDDEVFEAIAIPRTRPIMSREERMQKIQEDRVRQASLREQREASNNMLKELESVIILRPQRMSAGGARITSI
ncbi:Mysoin-binding motif of peroxisomes-domain-containing protein [Clohesyomyces aquaticus]|uniref:Vezatin n=1 Tax=Clohesyomyces aquaticus TaxID=1231657 RepID=A0A1Y2AAE6_9PLEO|nr:Mysoin-binding motif of peroxisomes-domain-containing protein [Clohesyomyces aquaticus]